MARWVRRLLIFVAALAATALVALVTARWLVDPGRLASFVSQRVRAATGRDFAVTGGLRVRILPRIALVAGDVRLANASWGSRPDMLQVRRVEGSIPLLPLLRGEIRVEELIFVEPSLFLESDPAGTGNWDFAGPGAPAARAPSASGGGTPLSLVLKRITIEKGSLVHRSGKTGEEMRLALDRLTLRRPALSTKNELELAGSLDDRPFTLTGQISPLEAFLTRGEPLAVDLALATEGATATLAGTVDRSGGGPLLEGTLKARFAGPPGREKPAKAPVAAADGVELSGKLTVEKSTCRFETVEIAHGTSAAAGNLVVHLDNPQPDLAADFTATWRTGDAGKQVQLSVDRLTLKRNVSTATNFLEAAGSLQSQPFSATGLVGPLKEFFAGRNPLALELSLATEGATASLAGKIGRDGGGLRPEAAVKVHVEGTSGLAKLAGGPVTLPVPLDLAGRLALKEDTWSVEGLTIAAAQGTVSGNLALRLRTPAAELTGALAAAWRDGKTGEEVRLTLDRLTIQRSAGSAVDSLDLAGSLQGRPFALAGSLTVKGKTWRMDRFEVASGQSRASGSLVVSLETPRPEVTAVLDAPLIDLPELAGWKQDDGKATKLRGRRLFSDAPLPFSALQGFDGRLQLKSARLVLAGGFQLQSALLDLDLRDGRLKIDPLRFAVGAGVVAGTAEVHATPGRAPHVSVSLAGSGISLEELVADAGYPGSVTGGGADLSVNLSGSGASVRSLMATLTGELRLSTGPARLTVLALAPGDILGGILETINPFRKKDKYTDLTCAVVRLPVRDGLVTIDRTVAYETEKVATAVAGTISLGSEALDLAIRPAVKSGFGMAGAPSTAQFVRIAGTLAEPKIELSSLATARTALSAGGAVATAGLSLIGEALFKTVSSDYQPCRTALERVVGGKESTAHPPDAPP